MHIKLNGCRHEWPEKAGFLISRPDGWPQYTFLHFLTPMNLRLEGKLITAKAGAVEIWYKMPSKLLAMEIPVAASGPKELTAAEIITLARE